MSSNLILCSDDELADCKNITDGDGSGYGDGDGNGSGYGDGYG